MESVSWLYPVKDGGLMVLYKPQICFIDGSGLHLIGHSGAALCSQR